MGGQEPDDETIQRRSENADLTLGCLGETAFEAIGCFWVLSGLTLLPMGLMILR